MAPALEDQPVNEGQEEANGLAALLVAPSLHELVTSQFTLWRRCTQPSQLAVPQGPLAMQLLNVLLDAVAHHLLAQEVLQVAGTDLLQTGHDVYSRENFSNSCLMMCPGAFHAQGRSRGPLACTQRGNDVCNVKPRCGERGHGLEPL